MNWLILLFAIGFEVSGTMALKYSNGFTKTIPTMSVFVFYGISFWLMALSIRTIPIGTAYAIWAGLGTALTVIIGIFLFKEDATWTKALFVSLIIVGAVGLKVSTPTT